MRLLITFQDGDLSPEQELLISDTRAKTRGWPPREVRFLMENIIKLQTLGRAGFTRRIVQPIVVGKILEMIHQDVFEASPGFFKVIQPNLKVI